MATSPTNLYMNIPNLFGKCVMWNNEQYTVLKWDNDQKCFKIKSHSNPESIFFVKPKDLLCIPYSRAFSETPLLKMITEPKKITEFDLGVELFDELEPENEKEAYAITFWKIQWLGQLRRLHFMNTDPRFLKYREKFQSCLENIIEICEFPDLIVLAKIQLIEIVQAINLAYVMELINTCLPHHFGNLPRIFDQIWRYGPLQVDSNFTLQELKNLYFESKNMMIHGTCAYKVETRFVQGGMEFLSYWKHHSDFKPRIDTRILEKEIKFLKFVGEKELSAGDVTMHFPLGELYLMEKNWKKSLEHSIAYQENCSSFRGQGINELLTCYITQAQCYVELGNKKMMKKIEQQVKKLEKVSDEVFIKKTCSKILEMLKIERKKKNRKNQIKSRDMKTKSKCSSYRCKNIESYTREFQTCSRCRIAVYCSQKCQKRHWKDGHKLECKKSD